MLSQPTINLNLATERLASGQCVVVPTETVYGLAGDATNGEAVARIFDLKGRPKFNPLICHVDGIDMAERYGVFDPLSRKLADAFWPGPLTLVVPLANDSDAHSLVTAGLDTIALRHPRGITSQLIGQFGKPLAAPSANRSGKVSPTAAVHAQEQFPDQDLLILDAGPCAVGLESTILKVMDERIIILRHGAITAEMVEAATGIVPELPASEKIEAPGMMKSHYAPSANLFMNCDECPENAAWLQFGNANHTDRPHLNLSKSGDLLEAAANLYGHLIELDRTGLPTICVSPIPMTGLGIAINDRLARAAAPRDET